MGLTDWWSDLNPRPVLGKMGTHAGAYGMRADSASLVAYLLSSDVI